MKITCDVIKDLLPLYVDDVVSEDSRTMIRRHLESCPDCREYYAKLKGDDACEITKERIEAADSLKKIKKSILRKRIIAVCVTAVVLAAVMLSAFYIGFVRESYVAYQDSGLVVNGDTLTATKDYCGYYGTLSPDGKTEFIYITDTMYSRHRQLDRGLEIMHYGNESITVKNEEADDKEVQLEAVYYLPEEYAKEVSLLRGDKHTSVSLPYFPEDQQEADKMVNELKEKSILIWEKN